MKPKFTLYQKQQKGILFQKVNYQSTTGQAYPAFGNFAIYSVEPGILKAIQLEVGRKLIQKILPKKYSVWVITCPAKSVSKKAVGVRIGKGKGPASSWVCNLSPGKVIYELTSNSLALVNKIVTSLSKKFPFKVQVKQRCNSLSWLGFKLIYQIKVNN